MANLLSYFLKIYLYFCFFVPFAGKLISIYNSLLETRNRNMEDNIWWERLKFGLRILFWASLLGCLGIWLYDYGFQSVYMHWEGKDEMLTLLGLPVLIGLILRSLRGRKVNTQSSRNLYYLFIFSGALILTGRYLSIHHKDEFSPFWDYLAFEGFYQLFIVAVFVVEISRASVFLMKQNLGPARILVGSFLLFIIIGTLLLMLPNASTGQIGLIDALFMSTSAVCITGLAVIDVSTELTTLGQTILMFLFQLGGIGIMTFTSFFAFSFRGGHLIQIRFM
jgi:trk system potassium uptake protein